MGGGQQERAGQGRLGEGRRLARKERVPGRAAGGICDIQGLCTQADAQGVEGARARYRAYAKPALHRVQMGSRSTPQTHIYWNLGR